MSNEQDQLTQQEQITQLLGSLLNPSAGSSTAEGATFDNAPSIEDLFGGLLGDSNTVSGDLLGSDLGAADETTLVAILGQQFQVLCDTLMALKSSPLAQSQAESLTKLESYLAYAQMEIEAIEQAAPSESLELTPSDSPAAAPPSKKTLGLGEKKDGRSLCVAQQSAYHWRSDLGFP